MLVTLLFRFTSNLADLSSMSVFILQTLIQLWNSMPYFWWRCRVAQSSVTGLSSCPDITPLAWRRRVLDYCDGGGSSCERLADLCPKDILLRVSPTGRLFERTAYSLNWRLDFVDQANEMQVHATTLESVRCRLQNFFLEDNTIKRRACCSVWWSLVTSGCCIGLF